MRPWRLTRRARVEMEAALAGLRRHVSARRGTSSHFLAEAARVAGGPNYVAIDGYVSTMSPTRILRARVALALRAALRADEDARCEEAHFAAHTLATEEHEPLRRFARSRVWGALDAIDALREWPQAALSPKGTIPRALWEVAR